MMGAKKQADEFRSIIKERLDPFRRNYLKYVLTEDFTFNPFKKDKSTYARKDGYYKRLDSKKRWQK